MSLFFKREREVRELIQQYFETADEAISEFEVALRCYLSAAIAPSFTSAINGFTPRNLGPTISDTKLRKNSTAMPFCPSPVAISSVF